jgi:cellulose synthase/poly-beta-1,6-N-acetylglucosamine synthase-like glycosyltransferase
MQDFYLGVLILAALFGLVPVVWAWRTVLYYWWRTGPTPPYAGPPAAVILPLRGADPSLAPCLRGLLHQDYGRYFVHVVVDSENDPAQQVVRNVLAEGHGSNVTVRVGVLGQRHNTCSLKVSAQLQALAEFDDSVAAVAFLDADSIPGPDWLRAMVMPLEDARVGATTGMRWFAPRELTWGNLVRHVYNAASFTQMHAFHIPWGGSLALRRETLVRAGLLEHWSRCFCEDTATYGALRRLGLRITLVPAASQFNREAIELEGAKTFILRQLLCVRLHHIHWPTLLAFNIANAAALTVSSLFLVAGLVLSRFDWALAFGGVFGVYVIGQLGALLTGEWLIRRNMHGRVADLPAYPVTWKLLPAAFITQSLSIRSLLATLTLRQIHWRGILYAIEGPNRIRLVEYQPFEKGSQQLDPCRSVV